MTEAVRTERVGRRPERTVYRLADEGRRELTALREQAACQLDAAPDPLSVLLVFAAADDPAELAGLLAPWPIRPSPSVPVPALGSGQRRAEPKRYRGGVVQRTVQTTDGRVLAVEEAGDPAGRPVLVHGGTPGSRLLYGPHARDAAERGLRLIGYDRPGYGGSSPQPGRTVADCADDVRAICADLGIDRLAMWGASGGGPHVLACAALLPDLVAAAATLASLAPFNADGLDYFDGMAPENVEDTLLFLSDEPAARAKTDRDRAEILGEPPGDAADSSDEFGPVLPPVDVAAMEGGLCDFFATAMRDGLASGSEGWWEDNCLLRPWGFSLADITVPVLLLHGRQDIFVPFGHGQWLAAHIPGVQPLLLDDDGHLSLLQNRVPEVHWWLSDHR